jgi:NCS1 family nucleobase:cation symporter-1
VTDTADPIAGIAELIPGWFTTVYFLVIVGGTITNNFLNCYSSALNLQAIGVRIARYKAVLIDAAIAAVMSIYALFVFNFVDSFIQFLSLMVIWIAPWTAIYLTDMLLRHNRYEPQALHRRDGPYWYERGWNWPAIGAFAAGIIAAALFANAPIWTGPLVGLVGNGDVSILAGFVVAGCGYYLLMRTRLWAMRSAQPQPAVGGARDG